MFAQLFKAAPADPQQSMDGMAILAAREALLSGSNQRPRGKHKSKISLSPCDEVPKNTTAWHEGRRDRGDAARQTSPIGERNLPSICPRRFLCSVSGTISRQGGTEFLHLNGIKRSSTVETGHVPLWGAGKADRSLSYPLQGTFP